MLARKLRHLVIAIPHAVLVVLLLLSLVGCGGGEPVAQEPQEQPVDPRFATADALLEHYNRLAMRTPVLDYSGITSLLYAETPLQDRLVRIQRDSIALMELEHLCWEEYGRCMNPELTESPLAPNRQPAVMIDCSEDRAKAEDHSNDGTTMDLHLVKVDRRWWISGYTMEYDPRMQMRGEELEQWERMIGYLSSVAPTVAAEVRSGKWGKDGDPDIVFLRLLACAMREHPEAAEEIRAMME